MHSISDYELELMKIIWSNEGSAMYADIVKGLNTKGHTWTKNTIITLLSRLTEKGVLTTKKSGRRNIYVSVVEENHYQGEQVENLLNKIFEGNTKGLVSALIERDLLTAKDYDELKSYWKFEGEKNE